jgi:hypothetical protein
VRTHVASTSDHVHGAGSRRVSLAPSASVNGCNRACAWAGLICLPIKRSSTIGVRYIFMGRIIPVDSHTFVDVPPPKVLSHGTCRCPDSRAAALTKGSDFRALVERMGRPWVRWWWLWLVVLLVVSLVVSHSCWCSHAAQHALSGELALPSETCTSGASVIALCPNFCGDLVGVKRPWCCLLKWSSCSVVRPHLGLLYVARPRQAAGMAHIRVSSISKSNDAVFVLC